MLESFFRFGWGGWGRTARAHIYIFIIVYFTIKQPVITGWCPWLPPPRPPLAGGGVAAVVLATLQPAVSDQLSMERHRSIVLAGAVAVVAASC